MNQTKKKLWIDRSWMQFWIQILHKDVEMEFFGWSTMTINTILQSDMQVIIYMYTFQKWYWNPLPYLLKSSPAMSITKSQQLKIKAEDFCWEHWGFSECPSFPKDGKDRLTSFFILRERYFKETSQGLTWYFFSLGNTVPLSLSPSRKSNKWKVG